MTSITVAKGSLAVSRDPQASLVAPSLGAALAVGVYDCDARVAGLLVTVFSREAPQAGSAGTPSMLSADVGLPKLFQQVMAAGAQRERLRTYLAGAAQFLDAPQPLNPGPRLYQRVRLILDQNHIHITGQHVGGPLNRSLHLDIGTGKVTVDIWGAQGVAL